MEERFPAHAARKGERSISKGQMSNLKSVDVNGDCAVSVNDGEEFGKPMYAVAEAV